MDKAKKVPKLVALKYSDRVKVLGKIPEADSKVVECQCYTSCARCK